MIKPVFQHEWLSETALLLDAQHPQSLNLSIYLAQLAHFIRAHAPCYIRQAASSFTHILIEVEPATDFDQVEHHLKQQLIRFQPTVHKTQHWRIGVDYTGDDLPEVAEHLKLSVDDVIHLHSQQSWRVHALGFAPGFAYLAEAPKALRLARRATARLKVPAGSVAIAEQFSAIYPVSSPGGWHLIGYTNHRVFDWQQSPPGLFSIGDWVEFYNIATP